MARKPAPVETSEESPMTENNVLTENIVLTYGPFTVSVEDLPASSVAYLLQYGFGKTLQDSASGVMKTVTKALAENGEEAISLRNAFPDAEDSAIPRLQATFVMQVRMHALSSGTMGTRHTGGGAPRKSTLESEMIKVAKEGLKKAAAARGKTLPKASTPEYEAILEAYTSRNIDSIKVEAERRLSAVTSDDLDDIFG